MAKFPPRQRTLSAPAWSKCCLNLKPNSPVSSSSSRNWPSASSRLRSPGPAALFEQTGGYAVDEKRTLGFQKLPDISAVLLAVALNFIVNSAHRTEQCLPVIGGQYVQRWKH